MDFLEEIDRVFDRYNGRQLAAFYTQKIDDFIINIFDSFKSQKPLALIAIGGYGRVELAPFSDIDIMFFAKDRTDSRKVESVLYKLWDSGLTIGHCFRTPEDCLIEARRDLRSHTSLLEARFVAGDRNLYNYFQEKIYSEIAYKKQKNFITKKLMEMDKRHRDYGGSIFLLEPNVKEGRGCLRDIHTILWLSKIALKLKDMKDLKDVISVHDYKRLIRAYDFLLKVRYCLHLLSGRRNDMLSFDTHTYIAKRLGFNNSKKFSGSERFVRYFYLKANVVKSITSSIAELCSRKWLMKKQDYLNFTKKRVSDNFYLYRGVIISSERNIFKKDPVSVIEAFYVYSKTGKDFSYSLREEIRRSLLLIGKRVRNSQRAITFFIDILKGKRVYDTLREMHGGGVLGRFIPEFGALHSLVVYEPYHRYTVDEHTLLAVKNLELLFTTKYKSLEYLFAIMKNVRDKEVLYMALLFHDIGKAAGKYHEEEGYKRLKNIVERFNLDLDKRQRIEFLVKNHILMSRLALTRETDDPETITQFADAAGDEESLRALYLMTYADMSAVNPSYWTEWKAYLLQDIYERTLSYLYGVKGDTDAYLKDVLSSYADTDKDELKNFLKEMPGRYLLSTPMERVYADYQLARDVKKNNFAVSVNERPDGTTEITIGALDSPGLFSRIVGFLSSKWMNILRARLYTGKRGLVIDKIQISNWRDIWWEGIENFVESGLKNVILEDATVSLEDTGKKTVTRFETFIELDNETSEDNTIIEFFTGDRHRLLYDVSKIFYESGLNIISARINTESDIAHDIFYIQHEGKKIDGVKIIEVIASLWEILKD